MDWAEILNRFAPQEAIPKYPGMSTPWMLKDGRYVATDGKAAIVLNAGVVKSAIAKNDGYKPPVESILESYDAKLPSEPFPSLPPAKLIECGLCEGSGRVVPCECEGNGCRKCQGEGFIPVRKGSDSGETCCDCNGSGQITDLKTKVLVFGKSFAVNLMHRFDGIPGEMKVTLINELLFVRFKDGLGVVHALKDVKD